MQKQFPSELGKSSQNCIDQVVKNAKSVDFFVNFFILDISKITEKEMQEFYDNLTDNATNCVLENLDEKLASKNLIWTEL